MPWNLLRSYNHNVGFLEDTTVNINTGQWVAVVNQDLPITTVRQWGVIQVCPALPNLFGDRPVLDSKLCYNLVEAVYGSMGVGTNGRIRLYITEYTQKTTIPISIYRWS